MRGILEIVCQKFDKFSIMWRFYPKFALKNVSLVSVSEPDGLLRGVKTNKSNGQTLRKLRCAHTSGENTENSFIFVEM
jgi:hypothetical protein